MKDYRSNQRGDDMSPEEPNNNLLNRVKSHIGRYIGYTAIGVTLLIGGIGSCYTVKPEAVGVVKTFGAYTKTVDQGLKFKIPYGIQRVTKVPITLVQKEEFGFRTLKSGVRSEYLGVDNIDILDEGTIRNFVDEQVRLGYNVEGNNLRERAKKMLQNEYLTMTGDLNLVNIESTVQYHVKDPLAYQFNVQDQRKTLRDMHFTALREVVGDRSFDEVLTIGKEEIQQVAKQKLQSMLDKYQTGIAIDRVNLQTVSPPKAVQESYENVNKAKQNREEKINNAWEDYNKAIPKASGEAEMMIEQANGYAIARVNTARGDVQKFIQVQKEYDKAPEVTRQRLYLETLEEILPNIKNKKIIEQEGLENNLLMKLEVGGASQ
jgi:membrane protease subunit HflK